MRPDVLVRHVLVRHILIASFVVVSAGLPCAALEAPNGAARPNYPLPRCLAGTVSQHDYDTWLANKAGNLLKKDKRRNRPCALHATLRMYKQEIHGAVIARGTIDPYTGDTLRWDLIHTWINEKGKARNDIVKQFYLLPTVDHKDPLSDKIDFEICSWLINTCKSNQTPHEFLAMCKKIVSHNRSLRALSRRKSKGQPSAFIIPWGELLAGYSPPSDSLIFNFESLLFNHPYSSPQLYFLPPILKGIITEETYRKWLMKRAWQLYSRDLRQGRPYAYRGARVLYKQAIHAAINRAGLLDPYTGETMKYELLGTWDSTKGKDWPDGQIRKYYLMPTVDHVDPYSNVLNLEICSWRINECKAGLTPDEFVEVCRRVAEKL
jgi:hypothetical protein